MMAAPSDPSQRLRALIHQLRLHKPESSEISGEASAEVEKASAVSDGGGCDLDDRGKVFSSIGFSESASSSRVLSPERFYPKRAAVLICLFEGENGELRVILTKRSSNLSSHSGFFSRSDRLFLFPEERFLSF